MSHCRDKSKSKDKRALDLNNLVLELKDDVAPNRSVLDDLASHIDSAYEKALVSCFQEFASISEPMIDDAIVLTLIDEHKEKLPGHCNRMIEVLNLKKIK